MDTNELEARIKALEERVAYLENSAGQYVPPTLPPPPEYINPEPFKVITTGDTQHTPGSLFGLWPVDADKSPNS
jgi:hypothetical protein